MFPMHTEHRINLDGKREFIIIRYSEVLVSDRGELPKVEDDKQEELKFSDLNIPLPSTNAPTPKEARRRPLGLEAVGLSK